MKRGLMLLMLLVLCMTATQGLAKDEGVIVQSSCSIVQSGEYYLVYCYALLHNQTDQVICLEKGTFDLQSGEQLLASHEVTQIWPYFLNPGEDGYIFDIVSFEPDETGQMVVPQITGIAYQIDYMIVDAAYANHELETTYTLEEDSTGDLTVRCELTNPTAIDAFEPTIAFGLYTDGGSMIYADGTTLRDVGIPSGERLIVRFNVDDAFTAQWKAYDAMPVEARISASFRLDED